MRWSGRFGLSIARASFRPALSLRGACVLDAMALCVLGRRRPAATKGFNWSEEPLRSTRQGETTSLTS